MNRLPLAVVCCAALSGCAALDDLSLTQPTPTATRPRPEETASAAAPRLPPAPAAPAPAVDSAAPEREAGGAAFVEERARQAYETGRWDVAEGYYLQLTRMKPRDAMPWFQLGNLYAEQGRLDSAERAYREALRRRDDARTLHNLGLVQVRLGVGALREAQKRLPADDPARRETREFLRTLLEAAQ